MSLFLSTNHLKRAYLTPDVLFLVYIFTSLHNCFHMKLCGSYKKLYCIEVFASITQKYFNLKHQILLFFPFFSRIMKHFFCCDIFEQFQFSIILNEINEK